MNHTDSTQALSHPLPYGAGARATLHAHLSTALAACTPYEYINLAYLCFLNVLLLFFGHRVSHAPLFFAGHVVLIALTFFLPHLAEQYPSRPLVFFRHFYPFLMFFAFFEELHYIVRMVVPHWQDHYLLAFEYWLFGAHPTVWLQQFYSPLRNDLFQLAYMTYFLHLLILACLLYARREFRAFWTMMSATALGYAIGYLVAFFFPIQSPYHSLAALHTVPLEGGPFTATINFIQSFGRVHGAAFPSLHVTGSFIALFGAWRYRRWLFWAYLPTFVAMCVATVWGRYHYVSDIPAGLLTGAAAFFLAHRLTLLTPRLRSTAP